MPASADAALLLDGAGGAEGLRELLEAAAVSAPALQPDDVAGELSQRVAVDLLSAAASARAGLAARGVRALVFGGSAEGLSAPVADAPLAGRALAAWLAAAGPPRGPRRARLESLRVSGEGGRSRAGAIAAVGGRKRLLVASGRGADALVLAMAALGAAREAPSIARDRTVGAALEAAPGPAVLWLRGAGPVRAVVLSLRGSARGLDATGVLLAAGKDQLLAGPAPGLDCATALFCASANLGPGALPLLAAGARELAARALPAPGREPFDRLLQRAVQAARGPSTLRVDGLDANALTSMQALPRAVAFLALTAVEDLSLAAPRPAAPSIAALENGVALRIDPPLCLQARGGLAWLGAPCPRSPPGAPTPGPEEGGPWLHARLNPAELASSLSRLGPLDALRGDAAGAAYALHLLFGPLLAHSGPATLAAMPDAAHPRDLHLDLHWPLHGRARPQ